MQGVLETSVWDEQVWREDRALSEVKRSGVMGEPYKEGAEVAPFP